MSGDAYCSASFFFNKLDLSMSLKVALRQLRPWIPLKGHEQLLQFALPSYC